MSPNVDLSTTSDVPEPVVVEQADSTPPPVALPQIGSAGDGQDSAANLNTDLDGESSHNDINTDDQSIENGGTQHNVDAQQVGATDSVSGGVQDISESPTNNADSTPSGVIEPPAPDTDNLDMSQKTPVDSTSVAPDLSVSNTEQNAGMAVPSVPTEISADSQAPSDIPLPVGSENALINSSYPGSDDNRSNLDSNPDLASKNEIGSVVSNEKEVLDPLSLSPENSNQTQSLNAKGSEQVQQNNLEMLNQIDSASKSPGKPLGSGSLAMLFQVIFFVVLLSITFFLGAVFGTPIADLVDPSSSVRDSVEVFLRGN